MRKIKTQKYLLKYSLSQEIIGIVGNSEKDDKTIASIVNCINDNYYCNVIEFGYDVNELLNPYETRQATFRVIIDGDVEETKLFVDFTPIYEY
jgi:hypothetical protein